jgi:hypothetical protein
MFEFYEEETVPELAFLQTLFGVAVVSFALVIVAFPVTWKAGWRAGRNTVRASLGLLVAGVLATLAMGYSNGEMATFGSTLGIDGAIQMGVFFLIMYSTGFLFVGRYISSLAAEAAGGDSDA